MRSGRGSDVVYWTASRLSKPRNAPFSHGCSFPKDFEILSIGTLVKLANSQSFGMAAWFQRHTAGLRPFTCPSQCHIRAARRFCHRLPQHGLEDSLLVGIGHRQTPTCEFRRSKMLRALRGDPELDLVDDFCS